NGYVLVAGGYSTSSDVNSAALYDPLTGTWTITSTMNSTRWDHPTFVLTDGNVLITGGTSGDLALNVSEIY
ncbi:unnamed protein product, partial [Rotaria socialis]